MRHNYIYVEHGNDSSMYGSNTEALDYRRGGLCEVLLKAFGEMREATIACNCVSLFHCYAAADGTIDTACYALVVGVTLSPVKLISSQNYPYHYQDPV